MRFQCAVTLPRHILEKSFSAAATCLAFLLCAPDIAACGHSDFAGVLHTNQRKETLEGRSKDVSGHHHITTSTIM